MIGSLSRLCWACFALSLMGGFGPSRLEAQEVTDSNEVAVLLAEAATALENAQAAVSKASDVVSGNADATDSDSPDPDNAPATGDLTAEAPSSPGGFSKFDALIAGLSIFVLAVFVGFEVITKVPPTLHTPLMSGSNAISGITLVGALLVASRPDGASWIGVLAVVFAMINVIGGFWVTHRMLSMFKR